MSDAILQAFGMAFAFPQQQVFSDFSVTIPAGITYIVDDENTGNQLLYQTTKNFCT